MNFTKGTTVDFYNYHLAYIKRELLLMLITPGEFCMVICTSYFLSDWSDKSDIHINRESNVNAERSIIKSWFNQ